MPELTFKGKIHVANHHLVVPFHELVAVKSKGLAKTPSLHDNLLLHGDDLLALKALLPTHAGKVKCIIIDPPYNTGNEGWAYNDKVNSPLMRDWLGKTIDREDLTRHDKWCCMMLPRLKLLRELLTEDGSIFICIDDNEVHHLRCLMDEVFGEENFVANILWQKKYSSAADHTGVAPMHDHILVYRHGDAFQRKLLERTLENDSQYKFEDENGVFRVSDYTCNKSAEERPNLYYSITNPNTSVEVWPKRNRVWAYSPEAHRLNVESGLLWWGKNGDAGVPAFKRYKHSLRAGEGIVPSTWWPWEEVGHTDSAKKELNSIFPNGEARDFTTVKPSGLIQRILQIASDRDSIILDSFAGSGTTAHAVLKQNAEDGGSRRFVLIECEEYADTTTAERIRRCIKGVATAKDAALKKGYGGSFSFFKLGEAVALQTILESKDLPSYETLAAYVFFTATGEQFDPAAIKPKTGFIGRSRGFDVYLLYTPDIEALKDLALDLEMVRKLPKPTGNRKRLVYAPTRFMDDALLHQNGIVFSQLPYEIYERVEKSAK